MLCLFHMTFPYAPPPSRPNHSADIAATCKTRTDQEEWINKLSSSSSSSLQHTALLHTLPPRKHVLIVKLKWKISYCNIGYELSTHPILAAFTLPAQFRSSSMHSRIFIQHTMGSRNGSHYTHVPNWLTDWLFVCLCCYGLYIGFAALRYQRSNASVRCTPTTTTMCELMSAVDVVKRQAKAIARATALYFSLEIIGMSFDTVKSPLLLYQNRERERGKKRKIEIKWGLALRLKSNKSNAGSINTRV